VTLVQRATARRRRGMAVENVIRQHRAEKRMDEQVAVHQIKVEYERADRISDLEMEVAFSRLYQVADDDEEREAVARAFVVYQKGERVEDLAVAMSVDQATSLLKANNGLWLHDGCGPDGTAA
jgi:hypothetical protein